VDEYTGTTAVAMTEEKKSYFNKTWVGGAG